MCFCMMTLNDERFFMICQLVEFKENENNKCDEKHLNSFYIVALSNFYFSLFSNVNYKIIGRKQFITYNFMQKKTKNHVKILTCT